MSTRPWILDDVLWVLIEPLLPPWPERSPGPRPVPDRLCLQGILYVLRNYIAWQLLPPELGFGRDRPAGGAWSGGSRPGSSTSCTASCSPS
ncbi:transposase [Streptomyces sp. WM6372]|uniref:transposase n=1 Tax=Streptomyces sp. WM6372 TaxID=1415555 RepID=UPI003B636707